MGLRRSFKPTNDCVNGNFENNLTKWGQLGSNPTSGLSIDTTLSKIGLNSLKSLQANSSGVLSQDISANTGDAIYISGWVYKTSGAGCSFYILPKNITAGALMGFTDAMDAQPPNQWVKHSGVFVTVNNGYRIVLGRTGVTFNNYNFDSIMSVNLTNLLTANLLALSPADLKTWCDLNIPAWFDGTMSSGVIGSIGGLK